MCGALAESSPPRSATRTGPALPDSITEAIDDSARGLGACHPVVPPNAPYDEQATKKAREKARSSDRSLQSRVEEGRDQAKRDVSRRACVKEKLQLFRRWSQNRKNCRDCIEEERGKCLV